MSDALLEAKQVDFIYEALSDVNTLLGGSTYHGWKMSCFTAQKTNPNAPGYHQGPVTPSVADGASFRKYILRNSTRLGMIKIWKIKVKQPSRPI